MMVPHTVWSNPVYGCPAKGLRRIVPPKPPPHPHHNETRVLFRATCMSNNRKLVPFANHCMFSGSRRCCSPAGGKEGSLFKKRETSWESHTLSVSRWRHFLFQILCSCSRMNSEQSCPPAPSLSPCSYGHVATPV